jgi:hypothetical protein
MNYADLFRVTLPETALEVAALVVLIVDLGFLRKASLKVRVPWRRCWAWRDAGRRCGPCMPPMGRVTASTALWLLAGTGGFTLQWRSRDSGADGADAAAADRFGSLRARGRVCGRGADGGRWRIAVGGRGAGSAGDLCGAGTAEPGALHPDGICKEFRQERRGGAEVLSYSAACQRRFCCLVSVISTG